MDRRNALHGSLVNYKVDWNGAPELDAFARVHAYVRAPRPYPSTSIAVTSMEFDNDGVLLVASDPKGGFRIFDFDTYLQKNVVHENEANRSRNSFVGGGGDETLRGGVMQRRSQQDQAAFDIAPIHCVETDQQCQSLAWHPTNPNFVVASYRSTNDVHLWDLGQFPQQPKAVFRVQKRGASGRQDQRGKVGSRGIVCFDAATGKSSNGNTNRSGRQIAVAGGEGGVVRVWDTRTSAAPVYTFGPQASSSNRSRGSSHQRMKGGKCHVNALCYSDAQGLVYYGDSKGRITAHDMRKFDVPAFSLKKIPHLRETIYLPGDDTIMDPGLSPFGARQSMGSGPGRGIVSLVADPANTGHIGFRTQSGLVGVVDASRSQHYAPPTSSLSGSSGSSGSSSSSSSSQDNGASTPSLRVVGLSLAAIPVPSSVPIVPTRTSASSSASSSTASSEVLPNTSSTQYQQARIGHYATEPTNTTASLRRVSPASLPYHAMKYLGGADPVLCVGLWSSCQLQLVPVDGKNNIRIARVQRRRGRNTMQDGRDTKTNQVDAFLKAAGQQQPGQMSSSIHARALTATNNGRRRARVLEGYQVVLEPGGGQLGGGVTAVACHVRTGKIVAALDNGKCVVASS